LLFNKLGNSPQRLLPARSEQNVRAGVALYRVLIATGLDWEQSLVPACPEPAEAKHCCGLHHSSNGL